MSQTKKPLGCAKGAAGICPTPDGQPHNCGECEGNVGWKELVEGEIRNEADVSQIVTHRQ